MLADFDSSFANLLPIPYADLEDNWALNPLKAINVMETADKCQDKFMLDNSAASRASARLRFSSACLLMT